jgi:hypothetical protein
MKAPAIFTLKGTEMTRVTTLFAAAALSLAAAIAPGAASAQADDWKFQGAVYGYFPSISGKTTFPPNGGSASASVDIDAILDNLKFTFMGSLEARKGAWGAYTDVIYLDVGGSQTDVRSLALGGVVPAGETATVNLDLKGWAWTVAGSYRALTDADFTADIVFGVRQLDVKPKLGWQFGGNVGSIALQDRAGNREATLNNWDAIIGVKGRAAFGENNRWFVPYYLDVGTGASRFTWQAYAGLGYSFGTWDVLGAWRYLSYDFKSQEVLDGLAFNGPGIAVVFRW